MLNFIISNRAAVAFLKLIATTNILILVGFTWRTLLTGTPLTNTQGEAIACMIVLILLSTVYRWWVGD